MWCLSLCFGRTQAQMINHKLLFGKSSSYEGSENERMKLCKLRKILVKSIEFLSKTLPRSGKTRADGQWVLTFVEAEGSSPLWWALYPGRQHKRASDPRPTATGKAKVGVRCWETPRMIQLWTGCPQVNLHPQFEGRRFVFLRLYFCFIFMDVLPVCISVHNRHVAHRGQKKASDPLKLQTGVNCHVVAKNWTQVLEQQPVLLTAEPSL